MELYVPLEHFQEVGEWVLDFCPAWKELVYHHRSERELPKELSKEKRKYGVIKGPVATCHNKAYHKMGSSREITTKHWLQTKR